MSGSEVGGVARRVVLVVDDEPIVRMLAVDLFEELGCDVLEAADGPEALQRLEERPDVSLMFTDCRMPGMSGPELAQAMRDAQQDVLLRTSLTGGHGGGETSERQALDAAVEAAFFRLTLARA